MKNQNDLTKVVPLIISLIMLVAFIFAFTTTTLTYAATTISALPTASKSEKIRILVIGNSFSVDSTEYLKSVASDAGYTNVTVGNIYKDAADMSAHYTYVKNNSAVYTYRVNGDGKWHQRTNVPMSYGLEKGWDIVILQPCLSTEAGVTSTFYTMDINTSTSDTSEKVPYEPVDNEAETTLEVEAVEELPEENTSESLTTAEEPVVERDLVESPEKENVESYAKADPDAEENMTAESSCENIPEADVAQIEELQTYAAPTTVDILSYLVNYVRKCANNKNVKVGFEMTWALVGNSNGNDFKTYYNKSQAVMYCSICTVTQRNAASKVDFIVPAGTSIQNARSLYFGDTMNRDQKHLTYNVGRYLAALTVAKSCGINTTNVDGSNIPSICSLNIPVLKRCAEAAIITPYTVLTKTYGRPVMKPVPFAARAVNKSVILKWARTTGARAYKIYRKASTSKQFTLVKTMSNNSFSYVDAVANNVVYSYYVQAVGDTYVRNSSSSVIKVCYLTGNTLKSVNNYSKYKIKISWNKNPASTGCQVQYSSSAKYSNYKIVTSTSNYVTLKNLSKNKKYYIRIRTYKRSGTSTYYSSWLSTRVIVVKK